MKRFEMRSVDAGPHGVMHEAVEDPTGDWVQHDEAKARIDELEARLNNAIQGEGDLREQVYGGEAPPPVGEAHALPPIDLDELDPGIRRVVALLREHGFRTCDSGDGKTKFETLGPKLGMSREELLDDGVLENAHVVILATTPAEAVREADRLYEVMVARGVELRVASIEATYCPDQKSALVVLWNVDDAALSASQVPS